MTTTDSSHRVPPFITEPQDQFVRLLKEITNLQWVRESLPVQSKYYEGLKQRHERETHLQSLLEKQLLEHRKKQDACSKTVLRRNSTSSNSNNNDTKNEPTYSDLIERLRKCEAKRKDIEAQMRSAETMLQDLHKNRRALDTYCVDLHNLYDEVVPGTPDDPSQIIERHLKNEVLQLANDIPRIEKDIQSHSSAQKKLYLSRELMEKAMMTLPGASTFLDRQALANHSSIGHHSLFTKSTALATMVDITVPSLKDAEKLASEAYELEAQASRLCKDVPLIPSSSFGRDDNVINVLTAYRGYRLKIETILRTQLNPRLSKLQSQLAMTKYHYEQKTIEWIDQQIIMLEDLLRQNGCLENISLEREISILRMGANAAIVAVAAETSGRVTVDDALEVNQSATDVERNGVLPEYSENARSNDAMIQHSVASLSSTCSVNNIVSSSAAGIIPLSPSSPSATSSPITSIDFPSMPSPRASLDGSPSASSSTSHHLPAYSQPYSEQQSRNDRNHQDHHPNEYNGLEAPPAYFR